MDYDSSRKQEVLSLARKIKSNQDKYPEVMQNLAETYLAMNEKRRKSIKLLWKHKEIRKLYRDSGGYSKDMKTRRKAGSVIQVNYTKDFVNSFHKAKNSMYDKYNWQGISAIEFLSMNTLFESKDIENINKYFRCVNALRYDESLTPVSFLRTIRQSVIIEILTFKMLSV